MDSFAGLPDRPCLIDNITGMIAAGETPDVFAISIDGFGDLPGGTVDVGEWAMQELAGRLGRLVRSSDVLAVLSPGVFALAGAGMERIEAAVVLERIRGVFAMPVEMGGHLVSLPVTIGVAQFDEATTAGELLALAERNLEDNAA